MRAGFFFFRFPNGFGAALLGVDTSLLAADTYSLSLTHRIGSIFDLALSGVVTTYEKDGLLQPNRDYKAEARLGIKF